MSSYSYERVQVPVQHSSRETTAQWVIDSIDGREKYRLRIHIEGFNQNEVRARVEGNRLYVYGERIENRTQGISKTIIEKYYNLPADVDISRPYVTFPSPITMQIDFPSKYHHNQFNRQPVPVEFYANKYKNLSRDDHRRIPIVQSRDSSFIPSKSVYQFRPRHYSRSRERRRPIMIRDRSGSPALSNITEESTVRTSSTSQTDSSQESTIFPTDFNSNVFYRSEFRPEIFTDDQHQRYIELKLDVQDSHSDDLKVAINGNDLIVQNEKMNFYKQITLPSNIDSSSLAIHHHHDKKLYITIKLLDKYSSFKYI